MNKNNESKPTLFITRGISGSGKSELALKMVAKNSNLVRINRDDMRARYFGKEVLASVEEVAITAIQDLEVEKLLGLGKDVIVDDTNLPAKSVTRWRDIANKAGANFEVINVAVSLETALRQNKKRAAAGGRFVPEDVIRDKFLRFTPKGKFAPLPPAAKAKSQVLVPYVADTSKPRAWIFDMDGTLSLFAGLRGPFEWKKVGGDLQHEHVVNLAKMVAASGDLLLITSARDGICRPETVQWLEEAGIPAHKVFMRSVGDMRKDNIVKNELFDAHIRDNYNVCGVVDDRLQVCRLWFDLGLPLFRVGDPEAVF